MGLVQILSKSRVTWGKRAVRIQCPKSQIEIKVVKDRVVCCFGVERFNKRIFIIKRVFIFLFVAHETGGEDVFFHTSKKERRWEEGRKWLFFLKLVGWWTWFLPIQLSLRGAVLGFGFLNVQIWKIIIPDII